MPDILLKSKPGQAVSKISFENAKIQNNVFRCLRKIGISFQRLYLRTPDKPDTDGDYWCDREYTQKQLTVSHYRQLKVLDYFLRGIKVNNQLIKSGWKVARIWDHDLDKDNNRILSENVISCPI
jgi:G:T-mismatch repair DNA endonuclease (very short patch repair protein)